MEYRKLNYNLGYLSSVEIPVNWRECEGIVASNTETNMGLAKRDYSIPCNTTCSDIMVVEGYWIWWCKTHNQPLYKCEYDKLEMKIRELENKIINAKKELEE